MPARSCFKVVARIHAGEKGGVKSMVLGVPVIMRLL